MSGDLSPVGVVSNVTRQHSSHDVVFTDIANCSFAGHCSCAGGFGKGSRRISSLCGKHQLILIFTWSIMLYIMFWTCADSFEQSLGIYLSNCVVCMLHILEDINLGVEGEVLGSKSTGSVTEKHRNNMTQDTTIYIYYCLFRF